MIVRATLLLVTMAARMMSAADGPITISSAMVDEAGVREHHVESRFQFGTTQIRVLLADRPDANQKLPVVYVLPVEARNENRYGDGLVEIMKLELHQKHSAIFVAPTFSHLPWYADHPTDPLIRQESYLLQVVVPFVEKTYPARASPEGRLLLGFSKSGWGAWSLLLRHPDVFERAAAWDAPLMLDAPGKYGSGEIFGTADNFAHYQISELLRSRSGKWNDARRLILLGYGNFHDHHQRVHALMDELQIAHHYQDGPERKHDWHSGWVPEAVAALLSEKLDSSK